MKNVVLVIRKLNAKFDEKKLTAQKLRPICIIALFD